MLTKSILALVFLSVGFVQGVPLRYAYPYRPIDLRPYSVVALKREPLRFAQSLTRPALSARSDAPEKHEKLSDDVDDILDEIDDVLEENAEDFVRSYVQKGGQ